MERSDTPRTDAFVTSCGDYEKWRSYRDRLHAFARGLEREIIALKAENERLRSALKGLLSDTQHVEHEDCEYGPCPVRTARQILKEKK